MFAILTASILSGYAQAYPPGDPGDDDYDITFVINDLDIIDGICPNCAYIPNCDDFTINLNFTYPSRETDPDGTGHFTLMKYEIYKQNYITGAFALAYSRTNQWMVDPQSLTNDNPIIQHNMAPNGEYFTSEPFHLYYVRVTTRKGHYQGSDIEPLWYSTSDEGNTETISFGACRNKCDFYYGLNLGVLNSSPANQAAGYYFPKYETENYIISTTPLNTGEELILDAGDYIQLLPNFSAVYGSNFQAYIDGCGGRSINAGGNQSQNIIETVIPAHHNKNKTHLNIFPNPNHGEFNVSISCINNIQSNLYIMDVSGRIIHTQSFSLQQGLNQLRLSQLELSSGIYFISVDGIDETLKMIISK
jgi:hypothetical protein